MESTCFYMYCTVYRVNHLGGYYILLTFNSLFREAANLAELAWHAGNMVEITNEVNKI